MHYGRHTLQLVAILRQRSSATIASLAAAMVGLTDTGDFGERHHEVAHNYGSERFDGAENYGPLLRTSSAITRRILKDRTAEAKPRTKKQCVDTT